MTFDKLPDLSAYSFDIQPDGDDFRITITAVVPGSKVLDLLRAAGAPLKKSRKRTSKDNKESLKRERDFQRAIADAINLGKEIVPALDEYKITTGNENTAWKLVADEFAIDVFTAKFNVKRFRKDERRQRDEKIMQLAIAGKSNKEIGKRVGLNPVSVSRLIKQYRDDNTPKPTKNPFIPNGSEESQ